MSQYASLVLIGASLALATPAYAGECRLIAGRRTWKGGLTMKIRMILIACVLAGSLWAPYVAAKERGAQEERAAEIVASNCVTTVIEGGTYEKKRKEIDTSGVSISSLTKGEGGWVSISAALGGFIDNIYYNLNSGETVCGFRSWRSLGRKFHKAPGNVDFFASTGSTTEKRPIAVEWDGYTSLFAGYIEFPDTGRDGRISATLPDNEGTCSGTYHYDADRHGTWSITCTNGLAASGDVQSYGKGQGASGEGVDARGNKVRFTIGAGN